MTKDAKQMIRAAFYMGAIAAGSFAAEYLHSGSTDAAGMMATLCVAMIGFPLLLLILEPIRQRDFGSAKRLAGEREARRIHDASVA